MGLPVCLIRMKRINSEAVLDIRDDDHSLKIGHFLKKKPAPLLYFVLLFKVTKWGFFISSLLKPGSLGLKFRQN